MAGVGDKKQGETEQSADLGMKPGRDHGPHTNSVIRERWDALQQR